MQVSLEISLFPLAEGHIPIINDFLREIHSSGLEAVTNGMSTQIFGEYDVVMDTVKDALRPCIEGATTVAVSLKLLNSHLPPDRWDPSEWS